ncbi:MAG: hypothetical protein ACI9C1_001963 [Candidatus Aldehydirespiratoraceae bacterium]
MNRSPARRSLIVAIVCLFMMVAGPSPVAGQTNPRLDLVSQTLVVHDRPAEIVFDVIDPPADARLRFRIFNTPLTSRSAVRESHQRPPTSGSRIANFECTLDGDCRDQATLVSSDTGRVTVTLLDEEIGEFLRDSPGTLAFIVTLLNEDGNALDQMATSLIIPNEEPSSTTIGIAFVGSVEVPLSHRADGSVIVDAGAVAGRIEELQRFGLPLTLDLSPEALSALAIADPAVFADVTSAIAGHDLLRAPWVSLDEEGWRAVGDEARVLAQYALGSDTIETLTGMSPTGIVTLDPDATPATLGLLRSAGATAVIPSDTQLAFTTRTFSPNLPFQLLDDNAVAIPALRIDQSLTETLSGDDPELAAVRAVAELLTDAALGTADRAVLLNLDVIDDAVLDKFLELVDEYASLTTTSINELFNRDLTRVGAGVFRGELLAEKSPDLSSRSTDLAAATSSIDTLAAMLKPDIVAIGPLRTQLLAAASDQLDGAAAVAYSDDVLRTVIESTSGLKIVPADRITLTDRRTDLPLTIINTQPVPLNVELVLSAEKIRFPDGERRTLRLRPGANPIVIPVETLASGDARVTATIVSPGGQLELGTGTIDIRSTALSGLGLIISVIALIVLGAWWIRTVLGVRRNRATATVSAASEDTTTPTEGES